MRKTVIIGNWKMHKTVEEATAFARELSGILKDIPKDRSVGVAPTSLVLSNVINTLKDSPIQVGAQSGYPEDKGAYTGQVSMSMIKATGADFVLIGHSEQRQYFGETDESVRRRVEVALRVGLLPVVCVGETLEEREGGKMEQVLKRQIGQGLKDITLKSGEDLILAYEPVWAIGTGKTATVEMAQAAHAFARSVLKDLLGNELANMISIQYGGSVKPDNARQLLGQADIDGLLVGGASLERDSFVAIARS